MIRITASHGRKVPAQQEYATRSFHASIDIEVADGDPAAVIAQLNRLWDALQHEVDARVSSVPGGNGHHGNGTSQTRAAVPQDGNGSNGHANAGRNGNGQANGQANGGPRNAGSASGALVTPKQLKFVRGLGARAKLRPSELDQRVRDMFGDPSITLRDITKRQASDLIDVLQGEAA